MPRTCALDAVIGENITYNRVRLHLSMSKLAGSLDVPVTWQQFQKYEQGINRVSAVTLYNLARIFKVTMESLVVRRK